MQLGYIVPFQNVQCNSRTDMYLILRTNECALMAVEGDISIFSVHAQVGQLGHQVCAVYKAHAFFLSKGSEILSKMKLTNHTQHTNINA